MSKPTMPELERIQLERTHEERRVNLAINLGMCPECGAELKTEHNYVERHAPIYLFGLIKISQDIKWDTRTTCPVNSAHYDERWNESPYLY